MLLADFASVPVEPCRLPPRETRVIEEARAMPLRRTLLTATASAVLIIGALASGGPARAATSQPCDLYAAGGTPCVAAHSTVRALYGAYGGNLYQVRRSSDGATLNIGVLAAGGFANAAAQ